MCFASPIDLHGPDFPNGTYVHGIGISHWSPSYELWASFRYSVRMVLPRHTPWWSMVAAILAVKLSVPLAFESDCNITPMWPLICLQRLLQKGHCGMQGPFSAENSKEVKSCSGNMYRPCSHLYKAHPSTLLSQILR